jgi:hypothetical protein
VVIGSAVGVIQRRFPLGSCNSAQAGFYRGREDGRVMSRAQSTTHADVPTELKLGGRALELSDRDRRMFLKDEYLLLQNQYEDFDRRSLTIKGWVASGAAAALAISFSTSYRVSVLIPVFVTVIALVFWYLEAKWKLFQYALADRIRVIEAYFRDDPNKPEATPAPFQVYHSWYKSYAKDEPIYEYEKAHRPRSLSARLKSAALHPFVNALYVAIIALSIISFVVLLAFPAKS